MKKLILFFIPVLCISLELNTCSKKTAAVPADSREATTSVQPQPQPAATQTTKPVVEKPAPVARVKQPDKVDLERDIVEQPDKTDQEQDITVTTSLGDEVLQFDTILFDYDSYELRPDAIATLEKIAQVLMKNPTAVLTIEGHCDERGTVEYNLALGEQRAHSVKSYFVEYGFNPENLLTISYGKEKPIDPRHNEEAWSKNRRAVLNPSDSE